MLKTMSTLSMWLASTRARWEIMEVVANISRTCTESDRLRSAPVSYTDTMSSYHLTKFCSEVSTLTHFTKNIVNTRRVKHTRDMPTYISNTAYCQPQNLVW